MYTKTEQFDTQEGAECRAANWRLQWGPGYDGRASVWRDPVSGLWQCRMTCYESCD